MPCAVCSPAKAPMVGGPVAPATDRDSEHATRHNEGSVMRVLVTTASKHGATAEIGARIGSVLHERGHDVEVLCPLDVRDVEAFDVVVLGSAVYAGHWQADAKVLAEREASALRHRPVWLFSSGPVGDPLKPAEKMVELGEIASTTRAREHVVFAGCLDRRQLGFAERAVVAALRVPGGDYRDWVAIDAWAVRIAAVLTASGRALESQSSTVR